MKALTLRLDDETYERLRCQAFDQRTSITALIRESLAAQRGGEAVDREALAEAIWNSGPTPWGWSAERRSVSAYYTYRKADAVLALLAARGDAAPTVSAGEVS